jgi:hypothetical protein
LKTLPLSEISLERAATGIRWWNSENPSAEAGEMLLSGSSAGNARELTDYRSAD